MVPPKTFEWPSELLFVLHYSVAHISPEGLALSQYSYLKVCAYILCFVSPFDLWVLPVCLHRGPPTVLAGPRTTRSFFPHIFYTPQFDHHPKTTAHPASLRSQFWAPLSLARDNRPICPPRHQACLHICSKSCMILPQFCLNANHACYYKLHVHAVLAH